MGSLEHLLQARPRLEQVLQATLKEYFILVLIANAVSSETRLPTPWLSREVPLG
jgi:hypothetical protein